MAGMDEVVKVILVGVGATVVMDVWSMIQKGLGMPTPVSYTHLRAHET